MSRLICIIVLFSLFASLVGCGSDQYAIEKRYWRVRKQAEKIFRNPHASPPKELEKVVGLLNDFIKKYPKSNLSLQAEFNISRLYIVKEEYEQARDYLRKLLDKYRDSKIATEIIFLIGNSYELEDNWDSALNNYKKIMRDYPVTFRGLDIPIYIAQHYKVKFQPDKMIAAFKEAIAHYRALADKYPNLPVAYTADSLIAQSYIALKDWNNAIVSLNYVIDKHKDRFNVDRMLLEMSLIYIRELKNMAKAKEALERLIKDYPKSNLVNIATGLLKELEKNE